MIPNKELFFKKNIFSGLKSEKGWYNANRKGNKP
jgi:hypothetical protein